MASKVEQWMDWLAESWKKAFPPIDAEKADTLHVSQQKYFELMEGMTEDEKTDYRSHLIGDETLREAAERDKVWVATVREGLASGGFSEEALEVYDNLVQAKWPVNALAASAFWLIAETSKFSSIANVIGAEGAYKAARDLTPARPDPSTAWKMLFTDEGMRSKVYSALRDLGWDDDYIAALKKVNQVHTDAGSAMSLWRRGKLGDDTFTHRLETLGFDTTAISDLKLLKDLIPGPGDLVRMALRESWDNSVAARWGYDQDLSPQFVEWMGKQGFSAEWAQRYWRAHWVLPSVGQGFEMLHRDIISEGDLKELLRISDIPERWRDHLVDVAYHPYTRVDSRRMHKLGILSEEEVLRSYKDLGYDDEKAANMTAFTIAYNADSKEGQAAEYRDLTRTIVTSAFQKGLLDEAEATTRLLELGFENTDIELLLSLATWQKEVADAPAFESEYKKDIKAIIERGYSRRVIGKNDAKEGLLSLGYEGEEAEYLLSSIDFWYSMEVLNAQLKETGDAYVSRGINRSDVMNQLGALGIPSEMVNQSLAAWDIERNTRSRRLSEAQYRKALGGGLINVAEYMENLRGIGYCEHDLWLLTAMATSPEEAGPVPISGPLPLAERRIKA